MAFPPSRLGTVQQTLYPMSRSETLELLKQRWQLRDVAGDAPRLVHGQHMGNVSIGFALTPIDVSEILAGSILHLVAAWNLLNGPWWKRRVLCSGTHSMKSLHRAWRFTRRCWSIIAHASKLGVRPED